jgi:hypothetical protein
MSAAARTTARSPATVPWLSVTEDAFAPMAMAATAAMLFITVLGNTIGESPVGPRRRKPLKNSAPERKSPNSLRQPAQPRAALDSARLASRQAARVMRIRRPAHAVGDAAVKRASTSATAVYPSRCGP